jgi:hypothetical protein
MRLARASLGLLLCSLAGGETAAVELSHRMQQALGGPEKIAGIRDFEERVKAATWDRTGKPAGDVRKRVRWVTPGYLRLDQAGPYDTYSLFFDGTSGWGILPDGRQTDLEGGELKFARKRADRYRSRSGYVAAGSRDLRISVRPGSSGP